MKPASARHRTDATAKALTAEAKRLGVDVELLGGAVDAVWWLGATVRLVDYKSPGGELQPSQAKLIARGCPLRFVSTPEQAAALVAEMKREALR